MNGSNKNEKDFYFKVTIRTRKTNKQILLIWGNLLDWEKNYTDLEKMLPTNP